MVIKDVAIEFFLMVIKDVEFSKKAFSLMAA